MCQSTMKNSEYLEFCKANNVENPNVAGFYFPVPVKPFRPEFICINGKKIPNEPILSCCFHCAYETYFGISDEDLRDLLMGDQENISENYAYYKALFPKEDLDTGVMISYTDPENIATVFGEFACFLCDMVMGY